MEEWNDGVLKKGIMEGWNDGKENQNNGILEYWNSGILEKRNDGTME